MGLSLYARCAAARRWLDAAGRATGVDLPRALERGGRSLERTEVLQPALVAVGLASANTRRDPPTHVTGHSLGELAAACWAASLEPDQAVSLAALRGRVMQAQAVLHPGGMVALHEPTSEQVAALIAGAPTGLWLAALNSPDETVLSGDHAALAWLRSAWSGRSTELRVSGPWHSGYMQDAVAPYRAALERAFSGRSLRAVFVSSSRGRALPVDAVPAALAEALVRPVRFVATVRTLDGVGVRRAVAICPSRATRSLLRRAGARRWQIDLDD